MSTFSNIFNYSADTATNALLDFLKDVLSSFGPWEAVASSVLSFTVGLFKGFEAERIKAIEEQRDKDLEALEKRSEIELMRLEEGFDKEIAMRKEKLSELDDQYSKEIDFLKEAQRKGQISGEEFQRRFTQVESEYKTKKNTETEKLTNAENSKKLELEREKKLKALESDSY
ncbi:hypothetical protein [Borrelia persica]|uniref:hypothetical protein n=1 Tax=Borrelia persica TaxID=44448 RepID=UPI0004653902|nr:hypothetical protein [Borrelia persica]